MQTTSIFATLLSCSQLAIAQCAPLEAEDQERAVANLTGHAILYPMDAKRHDEIIRCLFAQYEHPTRTLSSMSWDITNALLRIMTADPSQFFQILPSISATQKYAWHRNFLYASFVHQGACPQPDVFALARKAIIQARLSGSGAQERSKTLAALAKIACRNPT